MFQILHWKLDCLLRCFGVCLWQWPVSRSSTSHPTDQQTSRFIETGWPSPTASTSRPGTPRTLLPGPWTILHTLHTLNMSSLKLPSILTPRCWRSRTWIMPPVPQFCSRDSQLLSQILCLLLEQNFVPKILEKDLTNNNWWFYFCWQTLDCSLWIISTSSTMASSQACYCSVSPAWPVAASSLLASSSRPSSCSSTSISTVPLLSLSTCSEVTASNLQPMVK